MDASGRGDNRRQEGLAQAGSHVTLPIFVDLLLRPLREREVNVRMAQGAILRGVISDAMEVVNRGDVHGDPTKRFRGHSGDKQVRHKVLVLSARHSGDTPGDGDITSLAEEGHDAILDVVVAPGPSDQVTTACEDVMQEASKQRMAT